MQRKRAIGLGMIVSLGIVVSALVWPIQRARQQEQNRQQMFRAIQQDDTDTVRTLLESGVDANMRLRMGVPSGLVDLIKITLHLRSGSAREHETSALIAAALRNRDPEIVRLLLAHGADVNTAVDGWTPLTVALDSANGRPRLDTVQLLLEHGADPNVRAAGAGGDGPLFYALNDDGLRLGPLTKMLLEHGADPLQPERGGRSYLTSEIWAGQLKAVAAMLDHGANINARDTVTIGIPGSSGMTPLGAAIAAGQQDIVKMLLARGAPMEDADGEGLIADAVYWHDESFLKALLARGIRIDSKNRQGFTPLMNTAYGGYPRQIASMKMLLAHGASVRERNREGQTPLIVASWYPQDLPKLKMLLAQGADANAHDKQGMTALAYAAMQVKGGGAGVSYLLAHGANARMVATEGHTPLMSMAINNGDPKGVALLVAAGCDPNAQNRDGQTALTLAQMHHHAAIIQALRQAGATH